MSERDQIRRRYDRIAPYYDRMEIVLESLGLSSWRRGLWERVQSDYGRSGCSLLEVGIGTGRNMQFYPDHPEITGIDISCKMLEIAARRADEFGVDIELMEMDIEALDFDPDTFDCIVSTCVFCSVPDPVQGLRELRRVLTPGGRIYMLEHMRTKSRVWGWLMDLINPVPRRLWGAELNRRTVENIEGSGLEIVEEQDLWFDVVKYLELIPDRDEKEDYDLL